MSTRKTSSSPTVPDHLVLAYDSHLVDERKLIRGLEANIAAIEARLRLLMGGLLPDTTPDELAKQEALKRLRGIDPPERKPPELKHPQDRLKITGVTCYVPSQCRWATPRDLDQWLERMTRYQPKKEIARLQSELSTQRAMLEMAKADVATMEAALPERIRKAANPDYLLLRAKIALSAQELLLGIGELKSFIDDLGAAGCNSMDPLGSEVEAPLKAFCKKLRSLGLIYLEE